MTAEREHRPIDLRTFATSPTGNPLPNRAKSGTVAAIDPEDDFLIFDLETTTDPAMRCRVGFYQRRLPDSTVQEGIFYDAREAFAGDTATIHAYARERGLPPPMEIDAFRALVRQVHKSGGQLVGFNVKFDIARIALGSMAAKAKPWNKMMRGAFTFTLTDNRFEPRIQAKHLTPRIAFYGWSAEYDAQSRSSRKRRERVPADRGVFHDVRTLAGAILGGSFSLARLCEHLKTPTRKQGSSEHGTPLTFSYLDYARDDVQTTWECFDALRVKYSGFHLDAPLNKLFSEASIGKALLNRIGIQPNVSSVPEILAMQLHSYYGGRTEVRHRCKIVRVMQTDFTAMYPTCCTLMGLFQYIIAGEITEHEATDEARVILAGATAESLRDPAAWKHLAYIVQLRPDRDRLPVRARYQDELSATIGLNDLTNRELTSYTLADCIVAKLTTGKVPNIVNAIRFDAGAPQTGLKSVSILGLRMLDPYKDDLFRELVVMRERCLDGWNALSDGEKRERDTLRDQLKLLANSTSYGIFVQLNVHDEERAQKQLVYVHGCRPFVTTTKKVEEPGPFFNPLIGTLITGAARLMLTLGQHRAQAEGLGWAFCDTDSIALTKPDCMQDEDFMVRSQRVSNWFVPLNPYGLPKSILKIEDVNFHRQTKEHEPLYCYAIASKRYALFNRNADGTPLIRKASAHGLGHFHEPYGEANPAICFPEPLPDLKTSKDYLPRWQHDLWYAILRHALSGKSGRLRFDYHPALNQPVLMQYAANSPALLRSFNAFNQGLDYADQVKPFGLLYSLQAKTKRPDFEGIGSLTGSLPKHLHPVAPFHPDRETAIVSAFDRITKRPIARDELATYADALFGYDLKPESKFRNGEAADKGLTTPRHIVASQVRYIGKEADHWEENFVVGIDNNPVQYGANPYAATEAYTAIRLAVRIHGEKPVSDATGLSRGSVRKVCAGTFVNTRVPHTTIMAGLNRLMAERRVKIRPQSSEPEGWY